MCSLLSADNLGALVNESASPSVKHFSQNWVIGFYVILSLFWFIYLVCSVPFVLCFLNLSFLPVLRFLSLI